MLIAGIIYFNSKNDFIDEVPDFFVKHPADNKIPSVIDFQFKGHHFVIKPDTFFEEAFFFDDCREAAENVLVINDSAVAKELGEFLSKKFHCFVYVWNQEMYFDITSEGKKKISNVVSNYNYYQNGMSSTKNAQPFVTMHTQIYNDPDVIAK